MQYQKFTNQYLLLIEKNEEINETIEKFVVKEKIGCAQFAMLGSITNVTLGYIPRNNTSYVWKTFSEQYELINGTGLIAWDKQSNKPLIHCHITISDDNFETFGGHLGSATVAIMTEVIINIVSDTIVKKQLDTTLNIKTLDLTNSK